MKKWCADVFLTFAWDGVPDVEAETYEEAREKFVELIRNGEFDKFSIDFTGEYDISYIGEAR